LIIRHFIEKLKLPINWHFYLHGFKTGYLFLKTARDFLICRLGSLSKVISAAGTRLKSTRNNLPRSENLPIFAARKCSPRAAK
jgi:hypothetical protein